MVSKEDAISESLKALADDTRRGILGLLKRGQLSVLEIAEEFPMSRPAISKHLRILKEAGLVVESPAGRQRIYALEGGPLRALEAWLSEFNGSRARPASDRGAKGRPPVRSWRSRRGARAGGDDDWRVW